MAVMRHVRIGHEQVVVAYVGDTLVVSGAAIHRHGFAKYIAVADFQTGGLPVVLLVLRCIPDGGELIDLVVGADPRRAVDDHMGSDPGPGADDDIRADDAEGSDPHIGRNVGLRRNNRARIDHLPAPWTSAPFGSRPLLPGAPIISADATSTPSTSATPWNFHMPLNARFRVTLSFS